MLSNDQVFKPCTKSCKPNRPIPVAKRYSVAKLLGKPDDEVGRCE